MRTRIRIHVAGQTLDVLTGFAWQKLGHVTGALVGDELKEKWEIEEVDISFEQWATGSSQLFGVVIFRDKRNRYESRSAPL